MKTYAADSPNAYREYYKLVHLANVQVAKGNFEKASKIYDEAFQKVSFPLFADLNNALYTQCEVASPNKSRIKEYLTAIQKKGICVHTRYKEFPTIEPYLNLVEEKSCVQVVDTNLKITIDKAIASDQVLRSFSRKEFNRPYHPSLLPAIDKIDSVNYVLVDSILQTCKEKSIPLENLIGLDGARYVEIIYRHNGAWGRYNVQNLNSYATGGIIDARILAYVYDDFCNSTYSESQPGYQNKFNREKSCDIMFGLYGTNALRQYGNTAFVLSVKKEQYEQIEKLRSTLFLPNLYEDAKIRVYAYYHKSDGFYYPLILNLPYQGDAEIEVFEKGIPQWCSHYIKYISKADFNFDRK